MSRLAYAIRVLRQARGLTAVQFADLSGVSPAYISLIERGDRVPPPDTLKRLAQVLNVEYDVFQLLMPGRNVPSKSERNRDLAAALTRLEDAESDLRRKLG